MTQKRGALIVIEGLDRSGKSTQTELLTNYIKDELGKNVKLMKFPDRTTKIGQMINSYLKSEEELDDHVIHLLFSANRWELSNQIISDLTSPISPTTLILDRYIASGISFSTSKGLPYEWCRSPDVLLPSPDLVIFLDIKMEDVIKRGGFGEERYEKEEMQRKVRDVFKRIEGEMSSTSSNAGSGKERKKWVTIDAGRDIQSVFKDILIAVEPFLDGVDGPVEKIWEDKVQKT